MTQPPPEQPAAPRHANRLAAETSPYLLQHAHNPVDWYPWGDEALARARELDRPIFLSIGYAACHWCHVMERESFEDERTAALLNDGFVAIKVDREERPDLDAIYMDAVQQLTGGGGWPMSVFLTPAGRPFFGGTYFPDQPRHGMPSFGQVLEGVLAAWRERRSELEQAADGLVESINRELAVPVGAEAPAAWQLDAALVALERTFDARSGGWGRAPKFPQPMTIEYLLREHLRSADQRPLAMARRSLDAMADGGICDQLGGGFARYATDERWLVPHFEKMLYDNAQLARVYVHAWQATADPRYRAVAEATLGFMQREMTTVEGGFISSLDADTAGVEGATYVWSAAEVGALLGEGAELFGAAYGVSESGNWEGHTILSRVRTDAELAREHGLAEAQVAERLAAGRQTLLDARAKRPQPGRDDKVLTAWNGLAVGAFADAAAAFDEPRYTEAAARAADLVLTRLRDADGRLRRSWKDGQARGNGVLEDYSHLADGLLALYAATFDERWFLAARELADAVLGHFADPAGGFFDTADDHEALISRPKGVQDNALPSGGAMATLVLLRVAALTGEGRHRDAAEAALRQVAPLAQRYPTAFAHWLVAQQLALAEVDEVAIVGDSAADDTRALLAIVRAGYRPDVVLAVSATPDASAVPLLHDRVARDGRATAYVCHGFACRQPVTEPADLAAQLSSVE
jgi:uncharacterized protein YyaL (SSP411 family)